MKILVTGKNGQLGSEIHALSTNFSGHNFIFLGSSDGDITSTEQLRWVFEIHQPDVVINCAAYTAVDQAETDQGRAFQVNATGVENLVSLCEGFNSRLIHISTDYVFDGTASTPYLPTSPVSPIGVYGESKRKGEEVILKSNINAIIIRTAWVYSSFGKNFVKTMLRLGAEKEKLPVVNDQMGAPTYARDLAKACLEIATKLDWPKSEKIYHYTNSGAITWFDFASEIMKSADLKCKVEPIPSEAYPTPAKRPKYSVLNTDSIQSDFNIEVRPWKDALRDCLHELGY